MDINMNIIIIAVTAIVSFITFSNHSLYDKLIFWPYRMKSNIAEYYRFVTSGIIHADTMHLLFNMFTLYFFGSALAFTIGDVHYLIFYVIALIVSSISTFIKYKNHSQYRSLGASGAVAAVLFANIYLDPWNTIYLFAAIPIPAILFAIFYLYYSYRMGRQQRDNINHDAHLYGAIFGFLYMVVIVDPTHGSFFIENLKNVSFLK